MGKFISQDTALTFDDVLIVPSESAIEPKDATLKTEIARGFSCELPVLSAAMDRVTEEAMAIALGKAGGLGIVHRNTPQERQIEMVELVKAAGARVGAACGPFDSARAAALDLAGCDLIVLDCAHGHNSTVIEAAHKIKENSTHAKLMVGNIATAQAAQELANFADAIKVGVGPGSICTTRVVSGVGYPQLSAILEVADVARPMGVPVVADGGIKTSGDVAKALAAGASAVMLGNILAGCDEAPGESVYRDGAVFKEYRGMGSRAVLAGTHAGDRYLAEGRKALAEGVEAYVHIKGSVADILAEIESGVQVAMGYVGARTLADFHAKARLIKVSPASVRESHPHDLDALNA